MGNSSTKKEFKPKIVREIDIVSYSRRQLAVTISTSRLLKELIDIVLDFACDDQFVYWRTSYSHRHGVILWQLYISPEMIESFLSKSLSIYGKKDGDWRILSAFNEHQKFSSSWIDLDFCRHKLYLPVIISLLLLVGTIYRLVHSS